MANDNIIYFIRLISLIILILVIIYNIFDNRLKDKNIQILLAIIIMFIFLFIDPLSGFFIACSIFVIYYKLYSNNNFSLINGRLIKKNNNENILYNNYISNEHLIKAQNNIFRLPILLFRASIT